MIQSKNYHVHVYYELTQINEASELRAKMIKEIPQISGCGPLRKKAIGPHPLPMFEAWYPLELYEEVFQWMKQNRKEFSIMFHPLSGNDRADHENHSLWLGKVLPLNLDIFN